MQIAYLMNTYPVTSATFIRREIAALEARGIRVRRFAVRAWTDKLVDPADQQEAQRVTYLLTGAVGLALGALRESLVNPRGMARAVAATWTMARAAGGSA
jgi:hypothetical protein